MISLPRSIATLATLLLISSWIPPANCLAFNDENQLRTEEKQDRLEIYYGQQLITEFVYRDSQTLRPYFANVHTPSGIKVTRNHPPIEGQDQMDHATMHPGIWLGFGDLNGQDFWRNKAKIEHERFTLNPVVRDGNLEFATRSALLAGGGEQIGLLGNYFQICKVQSGIRIVWIAQFWGRNNAEAKDRPLVFGDQEEMGFGVRVATAITEKNGGLILSDSGVRTAKSTWGQAANWCDYSGKINNREVGLTVFCESSMDKPTWWHNRDYGLMVANRFGRAAMKHGTVQKTVVNLDEHLVLKYGVVIHEGSNYSPAVEFKALSEELKSLPPLVNPVHLWR